MKETPHAFLFFKEDEENDTITAEYRPTGNIQVNPEKVALCDFCGKDICKYKDLKNEDLLQPEFVGRAFRNGLPIKSPLYEKLKSTLNGKEKKEFEEMVLNVLINSETPWAVCSSCIKKVQKYQK